MNILLLNHYAGSPKMGMEFRPYYMAREWVKTGHNVKIVAGDFSHLRMKNHKTERDFEKTSVDGIDYHWIRTGDYEGNGVRRAITMFRYVGKLWLKAFWISREWKPDVVIASSTYPLETYAAQRIAKRSKAKLIHEVHDMWPSTLYEVGGMSKNHPFVILLQFAENSAYKKSDYVVSLLPHSKEYMMKHGMREDKFVHIPNGIVKEEWACPEELPEGHKNEFRKIRDKYSFIVGYFGGHAISNALDTLLDVAKKTANKQIGYVMVGNGVEKARLMERKNTEHIDNLYFMSPVSKKAIPSLLQQFDCVYMGGQKSPLYRFGLCLNKMFDSMMGGRPIVFAFTTPETVVEQAQCGFKVNSGDVNAIVAAIEQIERLSAEERSEMGQRGQDSAKNEYSYERLAAKFAELF